MKYNEMKLFAEIKNEVSGVIEAENNSAAWKQISRERMKDVNALITAAEKVNKDENGKPIKIDRAALVKSIREEIAAENNHETPTDPDGYMYGETMTAAEEAPVEHTPYFPEADSAE